jgi:purine-binding chemotaxis protein CheW
MRSERESSRPLNVASLGLAERDLIPWRSTRSKLTSLAPGSAAMFAGSRNVPAAEGASRRGDNPVIQLVGFRLDNEDYAIAITKIQEIILMKPITRIPQVPDFIEGLINLRGSVIPIINLRKRFGLAPREVDDETRTIVVNIHDKTVGCIVDAVTQVMRINRDQIQPPPLSVLAVAHQYISGLARLDERLLIILDIERLFDEQSPVVSGQWQEKSGELQGAASS